MMIIPLLEISQDHCVKLLWGDVHQPIAWHVDPVGKALEYVAAGAEWIHVTDVDALRGERANLDPIRSIIRHSGVPVQVGGGIRSPERAEQLLRMGAARVVLGTAAVRSPAMVRHLAGVYPGRIALSVDVKDGHIALDARREPTRMQPFELAERYSTVNLAAMIYTDVDAAPGRGGMDWRAALKFANTATAPILAGGMGNSLEKIESLKANGRLSGCLIGGALAERRFRLKDAIFAATPEPERELALI